MSQDHGGSEAVSEPTKLPWTLDRYGRIHNSNCQTVADCRYAEAKPELIVLAVNHHQHLVDALRNVNMAFNSARLVGESRDLAGQIVEENRALLAEIEKEAHGS
jgi:hypothetical protein